MLFLEWKFQPDFQSEKLKFLNWPWFFSSIGEVLFYQNTKLFGSIFFLNSKRKIIYLFWSNIIINFKYSTQSDWIMYIQKNSKFNIFIFYYAHFQLLKCNFCALTLTVQISEYFSNIWRKNISLILCKM